MKTVKNKKTPHSLHNNELCYRRFVQHQNWKSFKCIFLFSSSICLKTTEHCVSYSIVGVWGVDHAESGQWTYLFIAIIRDRVTMANCAVYVVFAYCVLCLHHFGVPKISTFYVVCMFSHLSFASVACWLFIWSRWVRLVSTQPFTFSISRHESIVGWVFLLSSGKNWCKSIRTQSCVTILSPFWMTVFSW